VQKNKQEFVISESVINGFTVYKEYKEY
jgi:hypothetical protein